MRHKRIWRGGSMGGVEKLGAEAASAVRKFGAFRQCHCGQGVDHGSRRPATLPPPTAPRISLLCLKCLPRLMNNARNFCLRFRLSTFFSACFLFFSLCSSSFFWFCTAQQFHYLHGRHTQGRAEWERESMKRTLWCARQRRRGEVEEDCEEGSQESP